MVRIKTEEQYQVLLKKVENLMEVVTEDTPSTDPAYVELDLLADLVEEYETAHYPVGTPSLADLLKLRMYEMNLTQKALAELLDISAPRVSEYLTGKTEPTLQVARRMHTKLNIDANVILETV
ncbi:helix-turn-helix domain-containing protein [Paludibacter sp. 221]|uniref:helix-turn-helix domain-containing protein n=1 Tax=Paludibacter sp. 221 TaxID=2302939 RepID=UPI0013D4A9E7|nr:helix-turn-helix domain-containing protein [Paludibacter sp. 221]NDV46192.1 helix-turn-helix domain-containing protein [Paludibacter sp. 221]